jgi:hypothetical protein
MSSTNRIVVNSCDDVAACPRIRINSGAISIHRDVARKTNASPDNRICGCPN